MDNIHRIVAAMGPVGFGPGTGFRHVRALGEIDDKLWGFVGIEASIAYRKIADDVYKYAGIRENYTLDDVCKAIDGELLKLDRAKPPSDHSFTEGVRSNLPVEPQMDYFVWRHIYGVRFERPHMLGCFEFGKTEDMKREFRPQFQDMLEWNKMFGDYVVRTSVHCVSGERAVQLADDKFTRLELLFAALLGPANHGYGVRVLRAPATHAIAYALKTSESAGRVNHSLQGEEHATISLDDEQIRDPAIARLFVLVSATRPTGMTGRIVRAIEWIGKGAISRSPAEAIICYCSAMEAVLVRDKNAMIQPSIVSSLSEYCAFLLGAGYTQRSKIERHVKDVYRERSAVAHGGKADTDQEALVVARNLAMELVIVISQLSESGINSEDELVEYIGKQKYGG